MNVWRWAGSEVVRTGDEVVLSGGRLLAIEPVVDAAYLRLGSIPDTCSGPYWVMEDVEVLATAAPIDSPSP